MAATSAVRKRQVKDEAGEIGMIAGDLQVFGHPFEARAELHGAALGVEAVAVIVPTGDHGENRFQMGISHGGGLPLDDAAIGAADHADLAVAPGLPGDPIDGVVAVVLLLPERIEHAFGFVTPADVLGHHGVAAVHEGLIERCDIGALAVRGALKDGGKMLAAGREKDIGGKADAVAHGNVNAQALHGGGGGQDRAISRNQAQYSHSNSQ